MNRYLSNVLAVVSLGLGLGLAMPSIAADSASDNEVSARVKESLAGVDSLKGANISVQTADGVVTLSGTVSDPHAKFAAVAAADTVEGVRVLNDELKTTSPRKPVADVRAGKPATRRAIADDRITGEVREVLAQSVPKNYKVNARTSDGVVYLSGDVMNTDTIERLRGLVAKVDGVKSVNTQGMDAPFITMAY